MPNRFGGYPFDVEILSDGRKMFIFRKIFKKPIPFSFPMCYTIPVDFVYDVSVAVKHRCGKDRPR